MTEQKNSATTANSDGKEINQKLDVIINYLQCLHKIQFSSLILQATRPLSPLHQSLLEAVQQEGEEWFRKTQESVPRRRGIRFLGDLSQSQDNEKTATLNSGDFAEFELYCIAKHLQAFLQLTVNQDSYFILPCRVCKFIHDCKEVGFEFRLSWMSKISNETGVKLSFGKGFRVEELPDFLEEHIPHKDIACPDRK